MNLLKFTDWRKDDRPVVNEPVSATGYTGHHKRSYVVVRDADLGEQRLGRLHGDARPHLPR
ncbi:MAG: hypothetical protein U0840_28400 [Gemmataceae bacterium]